MRPTLVTVYVVFWVVMAGYAVGMAAHAGLLVAAAVPFAAIVILALRVAGPRVEHIGWAAFTGWLGMTYAHTGGPVEVLVFFVYVALGALGVFRSAWFLAVAWLAHVPWDLLPRELPAGYAQLPLACMLFDGAIAAYLIAAAWSGRWPPVVADGARGAGAV
ncbi:MAG TPA: hypothetical protein VMW35_17910 [Myxococcota bacterium]|nr:hypothetical protein [Myxococcota bacterium]